MSPVVHFEMPYEDRQRMANFYTTAFGWQTQMMGPDMGEYVLASTGETDPETQMLKQPGMINGGFFKKTEDNKLPSVVLQVEDIHVAMKQVAAAGGKVLGASKPGEPDEIPGIGWYCSFLDTEGNRVGMLQPIAMSQELPQ